VNLGETTAALRRIPLVIYQDDGVTLATNADSSPPTHALQVSINGAAFVDAAGTFFGDGSGLYWYEATLTEASTQGFLAFKYAATGFTTAIVWQNVGQIFAVGETTTSHLRLPLVIYQDDGVTLGTGAATSPPSHFLQTSISGAAFADAAGTLVEVGSGLYYYQGVTGDVAARASLGVKFVRSSFQTTIAWSAVEPMATVVDSTAPTVTAIAPTPDTAPGVAGGMPSAYGVAALTPIAFTITDADGAGNLQVIQVSALFLDGTAEVVYRAGGFPADYVAGSMRSSVTNGFRFDVLRAGGWPAAARSGDSTITINVDAVDAAGNATHATLRYQMPTRLTTTIPAVTSVNTGAVDLFAEARSLVVWQLRA
jgi:hypothetical protein